MSSEDLKVLGNEAFVKNDFVSAEGYYTQAIDMLQSVSPDSVKNNSESESESVATNASNLAILLTNRSATRINLGRYEQGLEDAQAAIEYSPSWVKAYYRKSIALEKLGRLRESYFTWEDAVSFCETTPWLSKQVKDVREKWTRSFRSVVVESEDDFISRYKLLADVREKLSTLAHFWNECSKDERLCQLQYFISLIGGQGELSEQNQSITVDMMLPMPLHNYPDLPRERISQWCDYFKSLSVEEKLSLMTKIWGTLSSEEQHAVITDLRVFTSKEMQEKLTDEFLAEDM